MGKKFIDNLKIPLYGNKFWTISMVEQCSVFTYYKLAKEERDILGISDTLIRFSVWMENIADIIADIHQALNLTLLILNKSMATDIQTLITHAKNKMIYLSGFRNYGGLCKLMGLWTTGYSSQRTDQDTLDSFEISSKNAETWFFLDAVTMMNPQVWVASGHVGSSLIHLWNVENVILDIVWTNSSKKLLRRCKLPSACKLVSR